MNDLSTRGKLKKKLAGFHRQIATLKRLRFLKIPGSSKGVRKTNQPMSATEERLKQQNLLKTVFAGTPYLLVLKDRDSVYQVVNPAFCRFLGKPAKEIVGKTDFDLFPTSEAKRHRRSDVKAMKTGKPQTQDWETRGTGGKRWLHLSKTPVVDETGTCTGVLCLIRDITQEERAAVELRRLHEFNEKLLQLADSLIFVLDPEGKVFIWNDEAERISGHSREEVLGNDKIWERLQLNSILQREMQAMWQQKPVKDKSFRKIESNIQTKAGEERVMSWSGRTLVNSGGNLTAVIIVGHDVTEWKQNEQQLRDYTTQVERLNHEKSRLLSTTSHELRTPLTAIRGFADLLIREKGLSAEQRMKVKRIHAQAERLDNLLTELLSISRIESEEVRLSAKEVDLGAILKKVLQTLKPQMDEKGQSLTWDQEHLRATVHADPNAVEQILINLLANAMAYTPSRGGIAITLSDTGEFVRVDIADNGIGIPLQEQERIFYEFYRTEAARRVEDGGTGLGLSIVKRLVEVSGGSVLVSSPGEEKGSTFSFTLPKALPVQNKG